MPHTHLPPQLQTLPAEWSVVRVRDVFEIQQGKQVSKRNRSGDNQRFFLRTKNVFWGRIDTSDLDAMHFTKSETARLSLRDGDLLLCEGGAVGRTAIWRGEIERCYYQNHLHRLRAVDGQVDPEFALYWFWYGFEHGQVYSGRKNTTTIPNLSKSRLGDLPIALPPLHEQRKIADILSLVQRAIEQQEQLIALTTELKKAFMHKLFTEGTRGEPLKETEIGMVPEGWKVVELGSLFAQEPTNGVYKPKTLYGTGTLILRIDDFSNEGDIVGNAQNRVALSSPELERYSLREGDIVINRVNSLSHLGKTALIGNLFEPMVFESNMMRFRVDDRIVTPEFVFRFLNSPVAKEQIVGSAKRAVAQSSINQGDVGRLFVPLPSQDAQREITAVLNLADQKRFKHHDVSIELQGLFRTLLYHLMTGQVRVDGGRLI